MSLDIGVSLPYCVGSGRRVRGCAGLEMESTGEGVAEVVVT